MLEEKLTLKIDNIINNKIENLMQKNNNELETLKLNIKYQINETEKLKDVLSNNNSILKSSNEKIIK